MRATSKATTATAPVDPCCGPVGIVLDEDEATEHARIFAAVSDPVRLRLLSLVACGEGGEVCACDLTQPVGRSQPTVSHHMRVLHDAGLVERDKRGQWVWYRATARGTALVDLMR